MRGSAPTPAAGIECPEGRPPAEKHAALGSRGQGNKLRVGPRCPRRAVPHQVALSVHPRAWGPGRTRSNGLARHTAVPRRAQAGCKARWPCCPCASAGGRGGRPFRVFWELHAGWQRCHWTDTGHRRVAPEHLVLLDPRTAGQTPAPLTSSSCPREADEPAGADTTAPVAQGPRSCAGRGEWRSLALSPGRPQGPGSFRSAVAARAWRPRRSRVDRVADTGRVEERPARPRATCCLRPPEPVRAPRRPRWAPGDAAPCAPCPWGLTQ